jgi:type VI secretion system protein ImpA
MSSFDVEQLLQEVSPEEPCGEDLEYDPEFGVMERAAKGRPEQEMGDVKIPAEDPDWRAVRSKSVDLLGRAKDLRVATYLTRAGLNLEGLSGLRDGLRLIHGLLEKHWDLVHPQLDPDDNNDPTLRINTLSALCDAETMLRFISEAPLVASRVLGKFSHRDYMIAAGKAPAPSEGEPPEMGAIEAAFMDGDLEELQGTLQSVDESVEMAVAIEDLLTERVGSNQAPDLSRLPDFLKELRQILQDQLSRRGVADPQGEAATEGDADAEAPAGAAAAPAVRAEIATREDVLRTLDKVCEYYRKYEPSSPVPVLLLRAKSLVNKDFMEIMRDLAPDGLKQVEKIRGPDGDDDE